MKNLIILSVVVLSFALLALVEFQKTSSDMFRESYMAAMRKQTGSGAAEIRAEEYSAMREICDRNHNCTIVESASLPSEEVRRGESPSEDWQPYPYTPVWI